MRFRRYVSRCQVANWTLIDIERPPSDREEGFKAFFKGGPARIIRSSPQFGFTLVAYEYLHKVGLHLSINTATPLTRWSLQFVPVSVNAKVYLSQRADERGCSIRSRAKPKMWKRHSHRNQKIWRGYVPEMPFEFYWTSTVTSDPAVHSHRDGSFRSYMTLDGVILWNFAVEYTVSVRTAVRCVNENFSRPRPSPRTNKGLQSLANQGRRTNQRPSDQ